MRKNLVIVRAGDKSLHPQWLDANMERNWDIAVSYFGNQAHPYEGQYDYLHRFKGSKWQGIADFCAQNQALIYQYEYIWLPDDDLLTTCYNINAFFALCKTHKLTLAQPALLLSSFISHHITLQRFWCTFRRTNFVEIMAPCMHQDFFKLVTHTFSINSSGWGLEWLWKDIAERNGMNRFAIVDQTPVFHSRPVSIGANGGAVSKPEAEMQKLFVENNIRRQAMRNLSYYPSRFFLTHLVSTIYFLVVRLVYRSYKNTEHFNRK